MLTDARFREEGTQQQQDFIEWLISNENDPKKSFFCHTDVILLYQPDSSWHKLSLDTKRHWEDVYGFSVTSKESKGIAVIKLEAKR